MLVVCPECGRAYDDECQSGDCGDKAVAVFTGDIPTSHAKTKNETAAQAHHNYTAASWIGHGTGTGTTAPQRPRSGGSRPSGRRRGK